MSSISSIESSLNYLLETKNLIKQALIKKEVDIQDNTPFRSYVSKINNIQQTVYYSPKESIKEDTAVAFFDYDGTVLYTYTKEEITQALKRPSNITSDKVKSAIATGWNKTLETIKDEVNKAGYTEVGQTYTQQFNSYTALASIEVSIIDTNLSTVELIWNNLGLSDTFGGLKEIDEEFIIDWGDGKDDIFYPGLDPKNLTHKYDKTGKYTITMWYGEWWNDVINGTHNHPFKTEISLTNCAKIVTGIEYGELIKIVNFQGQPIETILIHEDIDVAGNPITFNSFDFDDLYSNYNIKAIVFPNMIETVSNVNLRERSNLKHFVLAENTAIEGEVTFESSGLETFCMYPNVKYADGCCGYCSTLKKLGIIELSPISEGAQKGSIIIPDNMFIRNANLKYFKFPYNQKSSGERGVTYIGNYAFSLSKILVFDFKGYSQLPACENYSFNGLSESTIFKIEQTAYEKAITNDYWKQFKDRFVIYN